MTKSLVFRVVGFLVGIGVLSVAHAFSVAPSFLVLSSPSIRSNHQQFSNGLDCCKKLISRKQHLRNRQQERFTFLKNAEVDDQDDNNADQNKDSPVKCWNPRLRKVIGGVATAGALETAYLTLIKLLPAGSGGSIEPVLCSTNGDCGSVLNGPYSWIPGTDIPLVAVGLIAYVTVAALAFGPLLQSNNSNNENSPVGTTAPADLDSDNRIALTALTTTMGVFSVFLMTLLFGVLKETCIYCIASAIFSISLAKLVWLGGGLPQPRVKEGVSWAVGGGFVSVVAAVFLFVNAETAYTPASMVAAGEPMGGGATTSTTTVVASSKTSLPALESEYSPPAITTTSSPQALKLAEEMERLNTMFFGAFWCSHCWEQKEKMGQQAMAKIPYIECDREGLNSQYSLCRERKIPGYPTWEINGKLYPGERDLDELEKIVQEAAAASE